MSHDAEPLIPEQLEPEPLEGIVIIGMSGRFPGAPDIETLLG